MGVLDNLVDKGNWNRHNGSVNLLHTLMFASEIDDAAAELARLRSDLEEAKKHAFPKTNPQCPKCGNYHTPGFDCGTRCPIHGEPISKLTYFQCGCSTEEPKL